MVPPTRREVRNVDAVEGVLEIGGPHADRVERQRDAGPHAQWARDQRNGAGDFAQAGDKNDLRLERHPVRRDRNQGLRHRKMRHARRCEERRKDPAHDAAGDGKLRRRLGSGGSVHGVIMYRSLGEAETQRCGARSETLAMTPERLVKQPALWAAAGQLVLTNRLSPVSARQMGGLHPWNETR